MSAFGDEKSKSDIKETLQAFDKAVLNGDIKIRDEKFLGYTPDGHF